MCSVCLLSDHELEIWYSVQTRRSKTDKHIHEGKMGSPQDNYCMKSESCTFSMNDIGGYFGSF